MPDVIAVKFHSSLCITMRFGFEINFSVEKIFRLSSKAFMKNYTHTTIFVIIIAVYMYIIDFDSSNYSSTHLFNIPPLRGLNIRVTC